jgi:hypothetical protein
MAAAGNVNMDGKDPPMRFKQLSRVAISALAVTTLAVACDDDDDTDVDIDDPTEDVTDESPLGGDTGTDTTVGGGLGTTATTAGG